MIVDLLLLAFTLSYSSAQILNLSPGRVEGFEYSTKGGEVAEVFLAIPYAAAPVGELRFEKPASVRPWEGVHNGTKFGATCHPHTRHGILPPDPSEDCLTLNVIRPKKAAPSGGYPILLWVHGGGYEIGSASLYGYKGFADIYIPHDIVVITIQYRLGIYGFFSSGDSRIPGNLGLFDMAAAVKFVHENAENIGGDASRITAWGLSAGGAAVGQLILSPLTRDYITRSIEMSGSPWAAWALGPNVPKYSLELAQALDCGDDLKNCMKQKTVEEIYDAVEKVVRIAIESSFYDVHKGGVSQQSFHGYASPGLDCVKWGPVIDGEFLQDPDEMAVSAPPKDSIVGVSEKEAAFFTIKARSPFIHHLGVKSDEFQTWNRDKLIATIRELLSPQFSTNKLDEVVNKVIAYYVDRDEEETYDFYLDRYTEFISDTMFNVAAVDGALARRQQGWNLFAYSFNHYNKAIWPDNIPTRLRGSTHVNEYPYMFDLFFLGDYEIDETEQVVADVLQQSFINFVKTGAPFNQHEIWQDIGKSDDLRYLAISSNPRMEEEFFNGSTTFWHRLREEYGYDLIKQLPTRNINKIANDEL